MNQMSKDIVSAHGRDLSYRLNFEPEKAAYLRRKNNAAKMVENLFSGKFRRVVASAWSSFFDIFAVTLDLIFSRVSAHPIKPYQ
jgi:hypothetical protein